MYSIYISIWEICYAIFSITLNMYMYIKKKIKNELKVGRKRELLQRFLEFWTDGKVGVDKNGKLPSRYKAVPLAKSGIRFSTFGSG